MTTSQKIRKSKSYPGGFTYAMHGTMWPIVLLQQQHTVLHSTSVLYSSVLYTIIMVLSQQRLEQGGHKVGPVQDGPPHALKQPYSGQAIE